VLHKHESRVCCVPNCQQQQRHVVGRCHMHRMELQTTNPAEYARLVMLSGDEAEHAFYMTKHGLPLPPWTYEGNEAELIRICDQNSRHYVKVGTSRPAPRHEEEN
jgi:hypothetical protein